MKEIEYIGGGSSIASMYMDVIYGGGIYSNPNNPHNELLTFINKK